MAFSAVCVTGLSVNNLAETYSLFGQGVMCLLVQIGGLGIMVLSAAIAMLVGQRMRVRSSAVLTEIVDGSSLSNLRRTVLTICAYTMLIEGTGILLLYLQFKEYPEIATRFGHDVSGAGSAEWAAVFHGVSAFCNAGFSNFLPGLFPIRGHVGVMAVMTTLIVLGGVGFPVLDEFARAAWNKLRRRRLARFSLHTRVVLRLTLALLGGLALFYLALEWTRGFGSLPYHERVIAAVFQSASARTAGFNVVDLSTFLPASLVLTCVAMFIGAAPGSTAGGIKVTTVAALFAGFRAELSGRSPSLLNRTLPEAVFRKAVGVASISLAIVVVATFLLLLVEPHAPLDLLFETVSAFTTTGLSTGVTPKLSTPGKLIIILMMFIGRIGPLTLALAVSSKVQQRVLRLPEERMLIG
jgi:trk system potassium uptake protein TrkH